MEYIELRVIKVILIKVTFVRQYFFVNGSPKRVRSANFAWS